MTNDQKACTCNLRKKVILGILGVVPQELCGISDIELADYMSFDKSGAHGEPVLALRYCPWCSFLILKEERITSVDFNDESDADEKWKQGDSDSDEDNEIDWRGTSGG
jgi:hypothetical protein